MLKPACGRGGGSSRKWSRLTSADMRLEEARALAQDLIDMAAAGNRQGLAAQNLPWASLAALDSLMRAEQEAAQLKRIYSDRLERAAAARRGLEASLLDLPPGGR